MLVDRKCGCDTKIPATPKYEDCEIAGVFGEINSLGRELYRREIEGSSDEPLYGLPNQRVLIGAFGSSDGGIYSVCFGNFKYGLRNIYDQKQSRVLGTTGGWVLALVGAQRVGVSKVERVTPIAYEADLAQLDEGMRRPLLECIQEYKNRLNKNGKVS